MASLSVESVTAACVANAGEASAALSRCLGGEFVLSVGEGLDFRADMPPLDLRGPGLALVFQLDGGAALLLLPESSGLLPDWYAAPDPTGKSKLATLAQEFGMLLLPEDQMPLDFVAAYSAELAGVAKRGRIEQGQALLLELRAGEKKAAAFLIWLATASPAEMLAADSGQPQPAKNPPAQISPAAVPPRPAQQAAGSPRPAPAPPPQFEDFEDGVEHLPSYTRSLLKIRVSLGVTLAQTKLAVGKVVELYPGSIIAFQKSVEQPLSLAAGDCEIAVGEAVKIGDKFGLRIVSMVMPRERFHPLGKTG